MVLGEVCKRDVVLVVAVTPGSASKEHVLLFVRSVCLAVLVRPENTPGVIFLT